jgi:hypothetical protein
MPWEAIERAMPFQGGRPVASMEPPRTSTAPQRLARAEDRGVAARADRAAAVVGEQRVRGVLDHPGARRHGRHREAVVGDQVRRVGLLGGPHQVFLIDLKRREHPVEDHLDAGQPGRLDLRAAVVGRHRQPVARPETEGLQRQPDGAAAQMGEGEPVRVEREEPGPPRNQGGRL